MLKERVLSAIVLIALVLCALFLFYPILFCLTLGFVATLGIWNGLNLLVLKSFCTHFAFVLRRFLGAFIFLWLYNEGNYLDAGRVFENYLPLLLLNSVGWWVLALVLVVTYPSSAKFWGKIFLYNSYLRFLR